MHRHFDLSRVPSVMKIAIGHGNKTSYISLEVKLLPTQWDAVRGKILNHPEKQVLNAYIYEVKQIVDAHIINLTREGRIKDIASNI